MLEFGSLLRFLRRHLRLTQTEMAELLHTSQPVYSRIEAGSRPVSMSLIERVAAHVEMPVERLIFAFFLLDENLVEIERHAGDPATEFLLAFAQKQQDRRRSRLKDAAALALLFDGPDGRKPGEPD